MATVSKILLTGLVLMSFGVSVADPGNTGKLPTEPQPETSAYAVTG